MITIGITGGIGAGKSQVMAYLEEAYGAKILLADQAGHLLMKRGQPCYRPVLELFGPDILDKDGELDRPSIAAKAFGHLEKLEALNAIIHPAVRRYIMDSIAAEAVAGQKYFFLEAALLIEEKYDAICQEMWYVFAGEEVRAERLRKSRGYSDKKIRGIMASQMPEQEFRRHVDFVLDNSGDFALTRKQIDDHMKELNRE